MANIWRLVQFDRLNKHTPDEQQQALDSLCRVSIAQVARKRPDMRGIARPWHGGLANGTALCGRTADRYFPAWPTAFSSGQEQQQPIGLAVMKVPRRDVLATTAWQQGQLSWQAAWHTVPHATALMGADNDNDDGVASAPSVPRKKRAPAKNSEDELSDVDDLDELAAADEADWLAGKDEEYESDDEPEERAKRKRRRLIDSDDDDEDKDVASTFKAPLDEDEELEIDLPEEEEEEEEDDFAGPKL